MIAGLVLPGAAMAADMPGLVPPPAVPIAQILPSPAENFGDVTTASDASGAMILKNLAAHEVRVGVRWSIQ